MNKISKISKILPKAIREQLWIKTFGKKFESKCSINWCKNQINVFDHEIGHNIPKSKGGSNCISNLVPICSRCNRSMSNNFTIDLWNTLFDKPFK